MRIALEPGEDSTSTAKVTKRDDGTRVMQWHIRLYNGKLERHVTKGKCPAGEIRRRARTKADELRSIAKTGSWKPSSKMSEYVMQEALPYVTEELKGELRPRSVKRYALVLRHYADAAKGFRIFDAAQSYNLEKAFRSIARGHGTKTAKQTKKVVSGYVIDRLVDGGVLQYNALRGREIKLPDVNKGHKGAGGRGLSYSDHMRVIDYLLDLDPSVDPAPKQGRYSPEQRAARRLLAIEVTLVQASCGLRISEARLLRRKHVRDDGRLMTLEVTNEDSKTHRGRVCPVTDGRVAERVRARLARISVDPEALVFPAPTAPDKVWDASNASKTIRRLYDKMAEDLEIPLLKEVSSHVWRTTLNTEWRDRGVLPEIRAAYFGHSTETNLQYYTDHVDVTGLAAMVSDCSGGAD